MNTCTPTHTHTHTLTHTHKVYDKKVGTFDGGVSELKKDTETERLARARGPARADKCFTNGAN